MNKLNGRELRSLLASLLFSLGYIVAYGQLQGENLLKVEGRYQLHGLLTKEGEQKTTAVTCLLSTKDGESFELTMAWQTHKHYNRDHLMKFTGNTVAKEGTNIKIRFSGIYDADGLRNSKARPPLPAIAWLEIDFVEFLASGKSKMQLPDGGEKEMNLEFLSIKNL